MTAIMSVQNWKISSHVMFMSATPSLYDQGQKKDFTPEKDRGGTAYRDTGSTNGSITHHATDCKHICL